MLVLVPIGTEAKVKIKFIWAFDLVIWTCDLTKMSKSFTWPWPYAKFHDNLVYIQSANEYMHAHRVTAHHVTLFLCNIDASLYNMHGMEILWSCLMMSSPKFISEAADVITEAAIVFIIQMLDWKATSMSGSIVSILKGYRADKNRIEEMRH